MRPRSAPALSRRAARRARPLLWATLLAAGPAAAEPFALEDMPAGFDGVLLPTTRARAPLAVDFDGDGQPSWYAGGRQVAHPKAPTPIDPVRYGNLALPAISLPVCPSCTPRYLAFAVGDVNRDGHPDIVRLNDWNGHAFEFTLQVFLGNGADGFSLGWRGDWSENPGFAAGVRQFQLALEDFDRDGQPDLALLSTYPNTNATTSPFRDEGSLSIRFNQIGEFPTATVVQARHFDGESTLLAGDFDRDGDVDLFVDRQVLWSDDDIVASVNARFFTNVEGSFTGATDGDFTSPLAFLDLDRDSYVDHLYLSFAGGPSVSRRLNARDGSFNAGSVVAGALTTRMPYAWAVADFDEDGLPDLMSAEGASTGQSNRLVLRPGNDLADFDAPRTLATLPANIVQMAAGDARGDADGDVLLRLQDGSFRLVRNQAQRLHPTFFNTAILATVGGLTRLAVADLDRDGRQDLLALRPGGPQMQMLRGTAAGFAAPEFKILAAGASDFDVGDFDRDGRLDYAYVTPTSGQVRTVTQNDSIFFGWTDSKIADYEGAALLRAGNAVIDNGKLDLLVASNVSGGLRWFTNQGAAQPWNSTAPVATQTPLPQSLVLAPHYFGFGDAGLTCSADGLTMRINGYSNVLGWFLSARLLQVQSAPQNGACAAIDLDDDAEREIVFVAGDGRLVSWKPENEDVVTTTTLAASVPGVVRAIAATDWNRDGLADLLVATSEGVQLYARRGPEEAWQPTSLLIDATNGATDVVSVDADRDGRPDAVAIVGSTLVLVRNGSRRVRDDGGVIYPAGNPLTLAPGQSGTAFQFTLGNPGRHEEDASIAVTSTQVRFNRAVAQAGGFVSGSAMTRVEVEQAVASVSLLMDGQVIGTAGTGAVAAGGLLTVAHVPVLGTLVPIPPDQTRDLVVRVNLKPGAAGASYGSFFLSQVGGSGTVRVLDGGVADGASDSFGVQGSNRVTFAHAVGATALGNGSATPTQQMVAHGGSASFTFSPTAGHVLQGVSGDACTPVAAGGETWTATITAPCQVTATFVAQGPMDGTVFRDGFEP